MDTRGKQTDSRPRHVYILDGKEVRIIFDHGEIPPNRITFTKADGSIVWINRKEG